MKTAPSIIAALDFSTTKEAIAWVERLDPKLCGVKIGLELFTRAGPAVVKQCVERGFNVFLDLKFHDIPNTVAGAVSAAADLGVWMINVHALGGFQMLSAAHKALKPLGKARPKLIAVTMLTCLDGSDLIDLGIVQEMSSQVMRCGQLAFDAGLDGVVCSGHEAHLLKAAFGEKFMTVTPGLRLEGETSDDQARVMTPREAKAKGSDYLVLGRTLRRAEEPLQLLKLIYQSLEN